MNSSIQQQIDTVPGDGLYRWSDNRNSDEYVVRPAGRPTHFRLYRLDDDRASATLARTLPRSVIGSELKRHSSQPAPRGWSRYSRPQGICQYCGAPCADTPSPTCDDC